MQLIASLIEAESGTVGVAGVETPTAPAGRDRWVTGSDQPGSTAMCPRGFYCPYRNPIGNRQVIGIVFVDERQPSQIMTQLGCWQGWGRRNAGHDDPCRPPWNHPLRPTGFNSRLSAQFLLKGKNWIC